MGVKKSTFQYKEVISVNRDKFLKVVVSDSNLNKKSLRVVMYLMTVLDGIDYKAISKRNIANYLDMSKSDVSAAIDDLINREIVEQGSSNSVEKGYKLLF